MPEPFPLFFPADARRAFGSEDFARRIARIAHLGGGSRVLELSAGATAIFLAREFGCTAVLADTDERQVEQLMYPREVLLTVQKAGFEPEDIQSLADYELDDYYRDVEPLLSKQGPEHAAHVKHAKEEIDLHRSQAGKAAVSLAIVIGR